MRIPLLALLIGLLLAGCDESQRPVATVNGEVITAAALARRLPPNLDTTAKAESIKLATLNSLIDKRLLIQEALRRGLEKNIEYQLELDKKFLVLQRLYDAVTEAARRPTDAELRQAYELLKTEAHLRLITVATESLAKLVSAELAAGAPFESVAARYSSHPSADAGGDIGFVSPFYLDEQLRGLVGKLKDGERTQPVKVADGWQIVQVLERRQASPAPPSLDDKDFREQLRARLAQQRRRAVAEKYLADMRARITYNEPGVQILMFRPVDSLSEEEKAVPVAIKDGKKYVKVERLLRVARGFPVQLDTALKRYAIRREIEEDLMYEDGLKRGLDKLPRVAAELAERRDDLLYQLVYQQEVADRACVTDEEIRQYYDANRQKYVEPDFERLKSLIRNELERERVTARQKEYFAELRSQAKITIDEKALRSVRPAPREKWPR